MSDELVMDETVIEYADSNGVRSYATFRVEEGDDCAGLNVGEGPLAVALRLDRAELLALINGAATALSNLS